MSISYSKEQYHAISDIYFEAGKRSSFKQLIQPNQSYLIKEFRQGKNNQKAVEELHSLLEKRPIDGSGYPIDQVEVEGEMIGYLCSYFPMSYTYSYAINTNVPRFSFMDKIKAVKDTTEQLKRFHDYGYIWNDVRLANHLIDGKGGHIIDFEESLKKGQEQVSLVFTYFYHMEDGVWKKNASSQIEDRRKQALCESCLLLNVDFENALHHLQENTPLLNSYFEIDKALKEVMDEIFFASDIPYFDQYLPIFQDPEKNAYNGVKMKKKMKKKLPPYYKVL